MLTCTQPDMKISLASYILFTFLPSISKFATLRY